MFDPQPATIVQMVDGRQFPVRRLFCIGRNYADHAKEMGVEVDREAPFYFTKWAETVMPSGATIAYPPQTANYHFEAELVIAIGKPGRNIAVNDAIDHVLGFATGLDMTRRDLQLEARAKGRPWDAGKNFEQSSPLGLVHPIAETGPMATGSIRLTVNGEVKQNGDLADLIHSVPEIIAYVSKGYRLEPGDLLYTGTPAGVGAVKPGDVLAVSIDGLTDTVVTVGALADD